MLRPEPGAGATAARARRLGLDPLVLPLFTVEPLAWDAPDPSRFDAVAMTSANAARHAGPGLSRFARLPAYAVGEATAAAMRDAGLYPAASGEADASALFARAAGDGRRRILHLCGEDVRDAGRAGCDIHRVPVYAARAVEAFPCADAVAAGGVALLHSPRAAALFAALLDRAGICRERFALVAVSAAAAEAAGRGWRSVHAAKRPADEAMLAIARRLCQNPAR